MTVHNFTIINVTYIEQSTSELCMHCCCCLHHHCYHHYCFHLWSIYFVEDRTTVFSVVPTCIRNISQIWLRVTVLASVLKSPIRYCFPIQLSSLVYVYLYSLLWRKDEDLVMNGYCYQLVIMAVEEFQWDRQTEKVKWSAWNIIERKSSWKYKSYFVNWYISILF